MISSVLHRDVLNMPMASHALRARESLGDTLNAMQVAEAGAATLVSEMVKNTWESVRDKVSRLFRRGGEESAEQDLRVLDAARQRLIGSAESEREAVEARLRTELVIQLAAFLQKHPDAADELRELAARFQKAGEGSGARANVHHNVNSQVVIANGPISNSGGFHYGRTENGQ
ncbi:MULTISPECIES: hypothetical protein [unclassified Streptomyces]|uniref:hypothetical protein n=1 Tax=unclassified Streptomyces TaxID=2593676 RepID=UPI002E291C50|nr:hypothetical protein [Streptomyces sp. NBC_00223]